ncbi:MAG: hypothetical protein LBN10_09810 [Propionibacteriaceae bacterium]|jgi:NitT/TauT family transport system substrate-binding protein|nr:hypothetical protein [Propionibacteriaceae bacterium]
MKRGYAVLAAAVALATLASCSLIFPVDSGDATANHNVDVAALSGPSTMGMVELMRDITSLPETDGGPGALYYGIESTTDPIATGIADGTTDVAMIPANLAAILNKETPDTIQVVAINTLSVLYIVTKGVTVESIADLEGMTVFSTGKGGTPEAVMVAVLAANDLTGKVNVQYYSKPTEAAAQLSAVETGVAVLPEPYITALISQDPSITVALDLGALFQQATGAPVVSGVMVARKDVTKRADWMATLLAAYKRSIDYTNNTPELAAPLIVRLGVLGSEELAIAAIPKSNIVYIDGEDMKKQVSGYLKALYDVNPELVGGALPGDGFYYTPKNLPTPSLPPIPTPTPTPTPEPTDEET